MPDAPPLKCCSICKKHLPTTDFYNHPHASLGVSHKCKPCARDYARPRAREYYRANREKVLAKKAAVIAARKAKAAKRRKAVAP